MQRCHAASIGLGACNNYRKKKDAVRKWCWQKMGITQEEEQDRYMHAYWEFWTDERRAQEERQAKEEQWDEVP